MYNLNHINIKLFLQIHQRDQTSENLVIKTINKSRVKDTQVHFRLDFLVLKTV